MILAGVDFSRQKWTQGEQVEGVVEAPARQGVEKRRQFRGLITPGAGGGERIDWVPTVRTVTESSMYLMLAVQKGFSAL